MTGIASKIKYSESKDECQQANCSLRGRRIKGREGSSARAKRESGARKEREAQSAGGSPSHSIALRAPAPPLYTPATQARQTVAKYM